MKKIKMTKNQLQKNRIKKRLKIMSFKKNRANKININIYYCLFK